MMAAAAVTRRVNAVASLHVEATNGNGAADEESRFVILLRLIAIIAFFIWRIRNRNHDGVWLWATSMVGDVWFGFSWVLNQLPKLNPIKRVLDLAAIRDLQHESSSTTSGGSESNKFNLPGIDVFLTTVDPVDEPILFTVNSVLSILATDYPVDKYACYLSDDGGTLVHYEAMLEVASFAKLWAPFCRKHGVEPRAPESYFGVKRQTYTGSMQEEFTSDHRRVRREYEEFKVRIDSLFSTIYQRSEAYNRKHAKDEEDGMMKATWMADGTQWPGTWIEQAHNHRKGQHVGIVKEEADYNVRGIHSLLVCLLSTSPVVEHPPHIKFKKPDKIARHIMNILKKEAVEKSRSEKAIPNVQPGCIIQMRLQVPENKWHASLDTERDCDRKVQL